jgi:hypothetical protein
LKGLRKNTGLQIVLPLIVLLIGLGAWRAWRRSPVYSVKTNFQLAGVILLMVAAIVALTLGAFGGPASHSATSKAVLIVLAVLLVLAGFIAVVFRITEGRLANLPPGARLLNIHRSRLFPWIRSTGVLLLAISGVALLGPSDWIALPLTLGAVVLLLGTSVLYPLYLKARRFDRGMTALLAKPWVHWQYTPQQWQSWAAIQRSWERAGLPVFLWKRDWPKLLFPIAIFGGGAWLLGDSGGEKVGVFLGCVACLLVAAALLTWAARRAPERRYRRMMAAQPEAYLGADGLFCSGEYSPWILSGNYLVEAAALRDPPARLVLSFEAFNGSAAGRRARLIPIPEGREGDLDLLQQQLHARCPKAAVHLLAPSRPAA